MRGSRVSDGDEGSSISGSSRSSRKKNDVLPRDGPEAGEGADEVETGNRLEVGLFGVLYTLSKERVDDSRTIATLKMLLDFLQQLVLLLGTEYGWFPWFTTWTASLTWMWTGLSYLNFAAKLSNVSYVLYEVALYGIAGLLALSLALCAYVGYCFKRHRFTYVWPVWFLRVVVSVFLQTFYVSAMGIFFVNINCHWLAPADSNHQRGYMDNYPTLNCTQWPYVFNLVVAIVLAFIFSAIVFVSTMADFEMDPRSAGLLAASHPKVEVINLSAKTVFLLASAILVVDIPKLQAIIFAATMAVQFYTTVRWVPFMVSWVNHLRAGFNLCNTWVSVMMVVLRYTPSAQDPLGPSAERLTLITIAGLPCFIVAGVLVSFLRLRVATRVAMRAFHSATSAVKPKDMYKFIDVHEVEVVARVCRKRGPERDTDDPEALALAERVLKSGIALFPHKAYAHILYSNFLIEVASLYQAGQSQLMSAKKLEPDWVERFGIFVREQQHMQRAHTSTTGESSVDLVSYVEFQRNYRLLVRATQRALASQQAFWKLLLRHKVHLTSLTAAFRSIKNAQDLATRTYRSVLERYPNSVKLLRSYARFQEVVLNNPWRAQQIYEKADQLEEQQASVQDNILLGNDRLLGQQMDTKKSAVAVINSSGIIQMTNKPLQKLFDYKASELEGQNVSILMPAPFSNRHNGYLAAYIATGQPKVIDTVREVVALHRRRHVFPIKLAVSKLSGQGADSQFLGVIQPVAASPSTVRVWLMTNGMTLCVDELFEDMFGTSIPNCIGRPFKDLVLEQDELQGIFAEIGTRGGVFTAVTRDLHVVHKYAGPIPVHVIVSPEGTPDEPLILVSISLRASSSKGPSSAGPGGASSASARTGVGNGPLMVLDRFGGMVFANTAVSTLLGYAHKSFLLLRLEALIPEHYQALHACGVQELMRSRSRFACRSGQTIFMCSSNKALVPVRLSISHKAEGDDSGLLSVVQVAKCSVAAGLAERRVQFEVDWAGCVTSVANQSGDVVGRMPSTSGRTSAAAAASLSKHSTQGSAPGGTDACTGSSGAGSAAGAGAASTSAAGIRAAAAGSGAQTHLFGLPPEGFIGCNLFKLIPELGALAPDEDLQDDILEELRLMSLQRLSPVFLRATLLPAVASETAFQRAKDAAAAAAEEALALQSTTKASDAADQDGGKVTAQQPMYPSHAHASLSRSGAFSASDVEVAAAASEAAAAAVPKEPGDVTPYNGPWNAFATAAAASIAATAASAVQAPAGAAAAGVALIQPSLSRPADAEQGSLHSVILGASGALAAVKELGRWRSRARTMAAGNRFSAAALAARPVILEIDGTNGDGNLVVSIWHPDKVASVLEVSRDGDIRQAVLDDLHPPGPVFGLTDSALQQYNLRDLLQVPVHTSLEDYLFPVMAISTQQPDGTSSDSRGGTILKRSALRGSASMGPRAAAAARRGAGAERGMVGAVSMPAGGGGRSSRRQATAQLRPQVGPGRNAAMVHADGKPLHIVVQGIAKRGTSAACYVRVTLSQRTEDVDAAAGAPGKGTLLSRLLGPGMLLAAAAAPRSNEGAGASDGQPLLPVELQSRLPSTSIAAAGTNAGIPLATSKLNGAAGTSSFRLPMPGPNEQAAPNQHNSSGAAGMVDSFADGQADGQAEADAGRIRMTPAPREQPKLASESPRQRAADGSVPNVAATPAAAAAAAVAAPATEGATTGHDFEHARGDAARRSLRAADAKPMSSETVRARSDHLQPAVLSPGSVVAHEGESWDTGKSDAVTDLDELEAGLVDTPGGTGAAPQPAPTQLAQETPAAAYAVFAASEAAVQARAAAPTRAPVAVASAAPAAGSAGPAAAQAREAPPSLTAGVGHAGARATVPLNSAANSSERRILADQDTHHGRGSVAVAGAAAAAAVRTPQRLAYASMQDHAKGARIGMFLPDGNDVVKHSGGSAARGSAVAIAPAATNAARAAPSVTARSSTAANVPSTAVSTAAGVHAAAARAKLGSLTAMLTAPRTSAAGSGGSASTTASASALDPMAVQDQTPTSRPRSSMPPPPQQSSGTGNGTPSKPGNYFQSLLQRRLEQGRAAVQQGVGQRAAGPGPVAEADEVSRSLSGHGIAAGDDPAAAGDPVAVAPPAAVASASLTVAASLRRSRVSSIVPVMADAGMSVAADDYAALEELDEEEEAALAAAALGAEVEHHDAGFQRGRRLKRISHVLEQPAAQAAINRFWRHSVAVTIALLLAHTGCFAGLIYLSNQQANCMNDMGRVTSGLESAYRVAVYTRALDTILKDEVVHFASDRGYAAPVYTRAGLPVYVADMSRYVSTFEAQHFAMYEDAGRTYGRGSGTGKALWDDRTYEVWTLLDGTATPATYLREYLSLFELGHRFIMYAREIADNYQSLGPPHGNLSDTRGFQFIRDEVVPELLPGYFGVATSIIQGCVADQHLLNQVLLALLVVEACCLCGAAVLYLLYRLVRVSRYQTSLFSVFLAIPSATVRMLTLRKLEDGEDDDDNDADADDDDLNAEDMVTTAAGGQVDAATAYVSAGNRLATAAPGGGMRSGSRAKLGRGLSRSLTAYRLLGPAAVGSVGNWGVSRSKPSRLGVDTTALQPSPRADGLRAAAFTAGHFAGLPTSGVGGPGAAAGGAGAMPSVTTAAAAAAAAATTAGAAGTQTPLPTAGREVAHGSGVRPALRSTRGRSISFRDHAPPGAATEDGHGSNGANAPGAERDARGTRHQPGRSGSTAATPSTTNRVSSSHATPVQTPTRYSASAQAGEHWPPSTVAPSLEDGSPGPAGMSDSSVLYDADIVAELQGAAASRQRHSAQGGLLGSKRLGRALHATVSRGRSLGQRALAAAASSRHRVGRFARQLLKRRSVMTGTNKILIANSLKDCWRLLPIVAWATLVISLYAYTYTISDWATAPLDTVTITSFTLARNVRMVYFAHELCANNTVEAIAASKAQLNRTIGMVAQDYALLLFGKRYEAPEAVASAPALSDAGYQVHGGHAGIARLGGHVGDTLYKGLNPDGSGGNCLRQNASTCFPLGHPYAVPSLNGLDVAFRHSIEAAEALVAAPDDQINIANRFLDFLFKVTSNDVQSALLSLRGYFDQQLHDAMGTWQAVHIGLFVATVVLFGLFLVAFVRPFVRSTRDEAAHVANMLSDLPPEVDIIRLVEAALGVGDSSKTGKGNAAGANAKDDAGDVAGAPKAATQMRVAAVRAGTLSNWLDKAGVV